MTKKQIAYRTQYLQSDHWKDLRLSKLASVNACCFYCWRQSLSNDVHHLNYRNLYDVDLDDLIVLCRECHQLYHDALKRFPELKAITDPKEMALEIIKALRIVQGKTPSSGDHFKELRIRYTKKFPHYDSKLCAVFHVRITDEEHREINNLPRELRRELTNDVRKLIRDVLLASQSSSARP